MSQVIINFPKLVKAPDYHSFDTDREALKTFGIYVKYFDLGWSNVQACYIGFFYQGDIAAKENADLLKDFQSHERIGRFAMAKEG
jgi:hypothetical protein